MAELVDKVELQKASAYARELKARVSDLENEVLRAGKALSQSQDEVARLTKVEADAADLAAQIKHKDSQIAQLSAQVEQQRGSAAKADAVLGIVKQIKDHLASL